MILDKEEHRNLLLTIINQTTFKGEIAEVIAELKKAIETAHINST